MLTSIISLLGGGLGALMRFIPEILKIYNAKQDQAHELRMVTLQLEIDKARATQQIDLVHAQQAASEATEQMKAYVEAVKGQSQMSGVAWVDGLSQSVRPVLTYWWQLLFTIYKLQDIATNGLTWGDQDWGMLSVIVGFWFVDRAVRYSTK